MIPLLNDCWRTEIQVKPQNWNTLKASIRKDWYIWYRFHDPAFKQQYPKGKLMIIKGMNNLRDLPGRQALTTKILEEEVQLIDHSNYNPITRKYMIPPVVIDRPIDPKTELVEALEWAFKNVDISPSSRQDMKSVLNYVYPAAIELGFQKLPIGETKRRHLKLILDKVGAIKAETVIKFKCGKEKQGKWTNNNFNAYKANLGILFNLLDEYELFESNPIDGIKRKKVVRKKREIMDEETFYKVDQKLKETNYYSWRYNNIFKESGARNTELMALKDVDVDLKNRTFKVIVKKRKQPTEELKEISESVFPLWEEIMAEAANLRENPQSLPLYLFSVGRRPGYRATPVAAYQVSRSWRKVKKKDGITADHYSMKHQRTTKEVDDFIEEVITDAYQKVAKKNSHTSSEMARKVYDVKAEGRREEIRKKLKEGN